MKQIIGAIIGFLFTILMLVGVYGFVSNDFNYSNASHVHFDLEHCVSDATTASQVTGDNMIKTIRDITAFFYDNDGNGIGGISGFAKIKVLLNHQTQKSGTTLEKILFAITSIIGLLFDIISFPIYVLAVALSLFWNLLFWALNYIIIAFQILSGNYFYFV